MSQTLKAAIAVVGIDIGKNSFHVVGLDRRGAMVLRQKWSRGQVEARLANMSPCLIGMEGVCWSASSQSEAQGARSRRTADAGQVRTALLQRTEE
jgi:transposase